MAVVDSGFIHPLWCGCGAGNGGGNGYKASGHVEASPPVVPWPVVRVLWYRVHNVCRWLITYYPTPLWFCGLWSGPCGLHEVYGLLQIVFGCL